MKTLKKPHYPIWMSSLIVLICLVYLATAFMAFDRQPLTTAYAHYATGALVGAYIALIIGLLSSLFILREKEALYMTVLISFMILGFDFVSGVSNGLFDQIMIGMFIILLIAHVAILWKLSYMCFGAVIGGGNYKK